MGGEADPEVGLGLMREKQTVITLTTTLVGRVRVRGQGSA